MPIASNDATNDADARPGAPPDHYFDEIDDAMETRGEAEGAGDRGGVDAPYDAPATDASEERDDEEKGGSNDAYGAENAGTSEGSGLSGGQIFANRDDAVNPSDDSGVDPSGTASKYFSATNENDGDEGSVDGSWKATTSKGGKSSGSRNHKQDDFVKNGARVKAILTSALRAVVDGMSSNTAAHSGDRKVRIESQRDGTLNDDDGHARKNAQTKAKYAHVLELAHEKAGECMALKRKLNESQSLVEILQNESLASQDANTHLKTRIDQTREALQIAGANAANARAEADASNARVESLTGQLNDLQSVIEETKRGMEVVRREHDEVSRAARSIEGRLIQVESELIRAARVKKDAVEERDVLKRRTEESEKLARELQDKVDDYRDKVRMMKKDMLEMEELEKVRSDRTRSIELEVKDARAGLLEATSAVAEAESTVTSLRSVVEELRSENECLHDQMNAIRDGHTKDRTKQNEAQSVAEREAQKWKIKCEEKDEEIRKLTMDKTSSDAEVAALRSRVANMERRINDSSKQLSQLENTSSASSSVTPHTSNSLGLIDSLSANVPVVSDETRKRKIVAELPMRETFSKTTLSETSRQLTYSYTKENLPNANMPDQHQTGGSLYGVPARKVGTTRNNCCLCSKEGGMMLRCQCGDIGCNMRGHAICIGKFRDSEKNDFGPTILCGRM
ncbi:hypothetical protein ACHAW5_002647 [Stephanodiscus triporus]|uniref:Uncharacterized protein n=1 Tax=Stephanodiscus triporus TaxID=2934178 RepID=A0ABD3MDJ2_9STRA